MVCIFLKGQCVDSRRQQSNEKNFFQCHNRLGFQFVVGWYSGLVLGGFLVVGVEENGISLPDLDIAFYISVEELPTFDHRPIVQLYAKLVPLPGIFCPTKCDSMCRQLFRRFATLYHIQHFLIFGRDCTTLKRYHTFLWEKPT